MRRRRSATRQIRYLERLRAAGYTTHFCHLPRALTEKIAASARQHGVTHGALVEAALTLGFLGGGLPSSAQAAQQRRRRDAGPASRPTAAMSKL